MNLCLYISTNMYMYTYKGGCHGETDHTHCLLVAQTATNHRCTCLKRKREREEQIGIYTHRYKKIQEDIQGCKYRYGY